FFLFFFFPGLPGSKAPKPQSPALKSLTVKPTPLFQGLTDRPRTPWQHVYPPGFLKERKKERKRKKKGRERKKTLL
ncbi:unnamed protein product, partial [Gulo gulo]